MLLNLPSGNLVCRTNFNLEAMSRFAWGRGIYLSKYPETSLLYGEALVVCKVLLGQKQESSSNPPVTSGWQFKWKTIIMIHQIVFGDLLTSKRSCVLPYTLPWFPSAYSVYFVTSSDIISTGWRAGSSATYSPSKLAALKRIHNRI